MNKKSNSKGNMLMKNTTRFWFLKNFGNKRGGIDYEKAADYCGVKPRTVRHWWTVSCPPWIDRLADISARAIPDNPDWRGFKFSNDGKLLLTPYANQSYSPSDLLRHFYEKQFSALTRVERDKLAEQLAAVRSEEEAEAIRTELDYIAQTLEKLKASPILAPAGRFNQVVKK